MRKIENESFYKNALSNINDLHDYNEINTGLDVKFDLIEIVDIMDLLGYSDLRSVRKFCIANELPLLNLGMKTYTIAKFLQVIIYNQLKKNYPNADGLINSIANDTSELTKFINKPMNQPSRQKTNLKTKTAEKLISNLSKP